MLPFTVKKVLRSEIAEFIERNHYSGSINGCISDYCYAMYCNGEMIGAMFYGRMAMAGQWKRCRKYGAEKESDVIELRRLCCLDSAPKNSESFFIGKTLRMLRREWRGKVVVSYADNGRGHSGIIYKASNFIYDGKQKGGRIIISASGKEYHDKAIRTKYKGELKPFAKRLIAEIESGEAVYRGGYNKDRYVYILRKW